MCAVHFEVLVEELSAERALKLLLPKMVSPDATYAIRTFNGKRDLLSKLPDRLRGYSSWITDAYRIVVLVDRDRDDCHVLKASLEQAVRDAGLTTLSNPDGRLASAMTRIAIEELEAWFFGDLDAVRAAYPGVPATLEARARYRDPDAVVNAWEALERVLKAAGHHMGGLQKARAASDIAAHMEPGQNRSASFVAFRDGIHRLGSCACA